MIADDQIDAAVRNVMDKFMESYTKRNLEGVLALFAPDDDVVLFGTGADEKRIGLAEIRRQVERDWSQSEAAVMSYGWISISASGSVAWMSADVTYNATIGGQELTLEGRLTNVLENRHGNWLIVQLHFSLPVSEQEEGESFPT